MIPTRRQLESYINKLKRPLLMELWEININIDEGEGAENGRLVLADVTVGEVSYQAHITFYWALFERSKRGQRQAIVHELLHCLLSQVNAPVTHDIFRTDLLPAPAKIVTEEALHREWELATDHLAKVLAPFVPLPPWGDK